MGNSPRKPTLAIVAEALLRPCILDPSIRKFAGLLIAFFWKAILVAAPIVVTVVVGTAIWMAYK